ncbi:unnamed protein product [Orchesella dallaii]|uniref:Nudix hydrolase domain-containing protein n=1 Tax=Orchesella dallaii TaxID=48710 RepID=A0ABP1PJY0_9HEXA
MIFSKLLGFSPKVIRASSCLIIPSRSFRICVSLQTLANQNEVASGASTVRQKAWNDAASLMIVAPMNNSEPYSLGYLMVERSRTHRVLPGSLVFPGGNANPVDCHPKWIEMFKDVLNMDILQTQFLNEGAKVPAIYEFKNNELQPIPKEVSLRITAIRETFEEAGILICKPRTIDPVREMEGIPYYEFQQLEDKKEKQAWQKRVRKNAEDFLELCKQLDCVPDIEALHDWNNWLTPANFKPKSRFDTMFYMIVLPKLVHVLVDGNEAVKAQWASPPSILSDHFKGHVQLSPPQIYEMVRLKQLKTMKELQHRLELRKQLGLERYFVVLRKAKDGTLFLLPGDDMYPNAPDLINADPTFLEEMSETVAQLKDSSTNFHRGIANADGAITMYDINVTRYGQIY